jgi:hypothetical protein
MSSKYRKVKKENITDKSYQLTPTNMMPKYLIFPRISKRISKKYENTKNRSAPCILMVL